MDAGAEDVRPVEDEDAPGHKVFIPSQEAPCCCLLPTQQRE